LLELLYKLVKEEVVWSASTGKNIFLVEGQMAGMVAVGEV